MKRAVIVINDTELDEAQAVVVHDAVATFLKAAIDPSRGRALFGVAAPVFAERLLEPTPPGIADLGGGLHDA